MQFFHMTVACWNQHCQIIWMRIEVCNKSPDYSVWLLGFDETWRNVFSRPRPARVRGRRHLIHLVNPACSLRCEESCGVFWNPCVLLLSKSRDKSRQGILLAQHDSCSSSNRWRIESDASRCITLWCVTKTWCFIGFLLLNLLVHVWQIHVAFINTVYFTYTVCFHWICILPVCSEEFKAALVVMNQTWPRHLKKDFKTWRHWE